MSFFSIAMKRFAHNIDIEELIKSKNAKSTDYFDAYTERLLNAYKVLNNVDIDHSNTASVDNILCGFYASVKKEDGSSFTINSFHAIHHSLVRIFKKNGQCHIMKDKAFTKSNSVFEAVIKQIKKDGNGTVKHYPVIPTADLEKIANWKWTTPKELQLKSWFTIHFHCVWRGRENLHQLEKDDLVLESDQGCSIIRVKDKTTKNHQTDSEKAYAGVIYATNDENCPVMLLKNYLDKLHPDNIFLWQRPKKHIPNTSIPWFDNMKVGVNTVNKFMCTMSRQCLLSNQFTNHSVRATAITCLGNNKFQDTEIASFSGHKSLGALGIYKRVSSECQSNMSHALHATITSSPASDQTQPMEIDHAHFQNPSSSAQMSIQMQQTEAVKLHNNCCLSFGAASTKQSPIVENIPQPTEEDFSEFLENPVFRSIIDGTPESAVSLGAHPQKPSSSATGHTFNYKCNVAMHFHIHK
jgi:hypothetical protein